MSIYHSIRIYASLGSAQTNNSRYLEVADNICSILGTDFNKLGFSILHPDYDYKEVGRHFTNSDKGRSEFIRTCIPQMFYGKCNDISAPRIEFYTPNKNKNKFRVFDFGIKYPIQRDSALIISVDFEYEQTRRMEFGQYVSIIEAVCRLQFEIHSAFLHLYTNEIKRFVVSGIKSGICTYKEYRILQGVMKQRTSFRNTIPEIFLMVSIPRLAINDESFRTLQRLVGEVNIHQHGTCVSLWTGQSVGIYLLSNYIPSIRLLRIRKALRKSGVIMKD